MKKLFLIPLMACFSCVLAWGAEVVVNNFADLKDALSSEGTADVVKLGQDIAYATNGSDLLNIQRSLTLDGQGHKIVGWGTCNSNHDGAGHEYYILTPLAINHGESASNLNVTIQNLTLSTLTNKAKKHEIGLTVFDDVSKLTINNCDIRSHMASGCNLNPYGIGFYGETEDALTLKIDGNSFISAGASGYGLSILKKVNADVKNSTFEGFSAVTFYAANVDMWPEYKTAKAFGVNNSGARGSVFYAKNCNFEAPNVHNGKSNAYGSIVVEDAGIDVTLDNCGINAEQIGNQLQACIMVSPKIPISHRTSDVNVTFTGDNSHINGKMIYVAWHDAQLDYKPSDFTGESYAYWNEAGISLDGNNHSDRAFAGQNTGTVNVIVSGGTYAINVGTTQYPIHLDPNAEGYNTTFYDVDNPADWEGFILKNITIPAGYIVQEITQDAKTLYRVVADIQTSYNINQDVPEEEGGAGENPNTNFIVQETTTLDNNATEANYVHVKDNGGVQTTLTVGKADADQTLTITNGMDVQDNAQVIIKSGSALVVENGGIISAQPSNIVIEADENGAASLLLSPTVTVNQQPNVTVKMTAKQVGYLTNAASGKDYYWHRFALPVEKQETAWEKSPNYGTWLFGWDYENNEWKELDNVSDMKPFYGYTLSPEHEGREDVTYTFTGKLAGNTNGKLQFSRQGYNFFGNSYTGYMNIIALLDQLIGDAKIDATVWLWHGQQYIAVPLKQLQENPDGFYDYEKEVAPMQTFILRLLTEELTSTELDYEEAIWNNPRYNNAVSNPAPARRALNNNTFMRISVSNENGESDVVRFSEDQKFSDSYDKGYDATKFMNDNMVNMYATIDGEDLSAVATDNIEGKSLTIQTSNAVTYTLSFDIVSGEEYAIKDNVTNKVIAIEEGATYEFAAQPNSTIEGRFVIMPIAKVPTSVENTEAAKANVKGIYTIMGQYLGENFDVLPAGVYVVDGVKIVK